MRIDAGSHRRSCDRYHDARSSLCLKPFTYGGFRSFCRYGNVHLRMLIDSPACENNRKYYKRQKLTPADSRLIAATRVMARSADVLDRDHHTGRLFLRFCVPNLAIDDIHHRKRWQGSADENVTYAVEMQQHTEAMAPPSICGNLGPSNPDVCRRKLAGSCRYRSGRGLGPRTAKWASWRPARDSLLCADPAATSR
jgi:hypothetical protein